MSRDIAGYGYSSSQLAQSSVQPSSVQFSVARFISVWATHSTVGSCRACPKETERKIRQREIEKEREGGEWEMGSVSGSDCDFVLLFYEKKKTTKKSSSKKPKKEEKHTKETYI